MDIIERLKGKIIVSSQASIEEPFYNEVCMRAMMQSVISGGAGALRVAGVRDVKIAKEFNVPVIGLTKPEKLPENWKDIVYITPTLDDVKKLSEAGADIIAFDGTQRRRPDGSSLSDMIYMIHVAGKIAMADIATLEEGIKCISYGADVVSTTLSGYTMESLKDDDRPDFKLLSNLIRSVDKPVILEGRIWEIDDVKRAFDIGAHCVVIGSAITRPHLITQRFVNYNQ